MSDPMRDPLDLRLRMARRIGLTTRVAVEVDDVLAAISRIEEYDRLRWVVKGAHGALADAGTVVVPGVLDGDLAPAIRQLTRERDEARAEVEHLRAPVHDPATCRLCKGFRKL